MNVVILLGRLTKEPQPSVTPSGMQVLRFTLAVDRIKKKDQETDADFISCVAFQNTAEVISRYCHKGQRILIEGRLKAGSYMDKSGNKRYTTDVIVGRMEFIEKRTSPEQNSFEDMGTVIYHEPEPMEQEEIQF